LDRERRGRVDGLRRGDQVASVGQAALQERQSDRIDIGPIRQNRRSDAAQGILLETALAGEEAAERGGRPIVRQRR